MLRHLGYMGATRSIDACTCRFCRPEEATPDRLKGLVRDNIRDLARILLFNAERGVAFYRVSSRIIPYGSHPGNVVPWWDEFGVELAELGEFARRHGLRLEMHPGHHSLLNAPSPETVALSILELGWHVRFLDSMHLDASHKLVVRIGGTFGHKQRALGRFVSVVNGLPDSWRSRLVIENDGVHYDLPDVLDASDRTGLPVVLSCFHQGLDNGPKLEENGSVDRCFATWRSQDGPVIVHLGSPTGSCVRSNARREWVEPEDLESLLMILPESVAFDCLLEAEQGDRALFEVRERMGNVEQGVIPKQSDSIRMPHP